MSKIEQHADDLVAAAINLRAAVKQEDWKGAKEQDAQITVHLSVIAAIVEAVEELKPKPQLSLFQMPREMKQRKMRDGISRPGTLVRHIRKVTEGMAVGEGRLVPPCEGYDATRLQASVTSALSHDWGNGTYMSQRRKDGVYVVRTQ